MVSILFPTGKRSILVDNKYRRIGKNFATGDMIGVVVAVDNQLDLFVEPRLQLPLQPGGGSGIDGIGEDNSFIGNKEHAVMVIVLEPVQLTGDIDDAPDGIILRKSTSAMEKN